MTDIAMQVHGGAGGLHARLDDMRATAAAIAHVGSVLAAVEVTLHRSLVNVALEATALLDPIGSSRVDATMAAALDGPDGLTALLVEIAARATELELAADTYAAVDAAQARLADALRGTRDVLVVSGAILLLPQEIGALAVWAGTEVLQGKDPLSDGEGFAERWLVEHPGVVSSAADDLPFVADGLTAAFDAVTAGLFSSTFTHLSGRSPYVRDIGELAGLLGLAYPDGTLVLTSLGKQGRGTVQDTPPAGIHDLLQSLSYRDAKASGAGQGQIDIRTVTYTDEHGQQHTVAIVDIPGTKDWNITHPGATVTDADTNVHAMAGDPTTYERGVLEAIAGAGLPKGTNVMLVGHSQGGMVATRAAADATSLGYKDFQITDIVTAGSPVGAYRVPSDVHVLQIQNSDDIVPRLDGQPDPDAVNRVQVTFAKQTGSIGGNHDLADVYVRAATDIDSSSDPSIAAFRQHAAQFLPTGAQNVQVTTNVYQVTRTQ